MSRPPRTVLANLINDVMVAGPTPDYRAAMARVTPRKLWTAEDGDCVVTLAPVPDDFARYVSRTSGLDLSTIDVVAPSRVFDGHAVDVVEAEGAWDLVQSRPDLAPFVIDRRVTFVARRDRLRILPYRDPPSDQTLDAVSRINTKDGFRSVARSLGLPVADGGTAASVARLADEVEKFLIERDAAIVKPDRGSNGFGNTVVRHRDRQAVEAFLDRALSSAPNGSGWVYEEFLPFEAVPSIEMVVDDTGPHLLYTCDQRTIDNAWTGMVTPAAATPLSAQMHDAAARIGTWLGDQGYRGVYDVDCGVTPTGFVVTEANVRRTGGTYLHELAEILLPGPPVRHWRADARGGGRSMTFADAVRALDAAALDEPGGAVRAVLTADTFADDGKWRYLVVGADADVVEAAEEALLDVLGIQ